MRIASRATPPATQHARSLGLQFRADFRKIGRRQPVDGDLPRAHDLEGRRAAQQAEGGHDAGTGRADHLRDLQLAGDAHTVQRPRPAEDHHARPAVVDTPLGGMDAKGPGATSSLITSCMPQAASHEIDAERVCHLRGYRPACRILVERHLAAEEGAGAEIAQQKIGIRQGRPLPSPAVAGRPRVGARATRPHRQSAALVGAGKAAAAGADLDHVDHGDLGRQAATSLELVNARPPPSRSA